MKAIYTLGVSASGKSTWAKEFMREQEALGIHWVKIERDCIRRSIMIREGISSHIIWSKWNPKWEREVTKACDALLEQAAAQRKNVILCNTHLNEKHRASMIQNLKELGYEIEEQRFEVSWEEAVRRDSERKESVGVSTLARQFDQWNKQFKRQVEAPGMLNLKGNAVVIDLDGTLAHPVGRSYYDVGASMGDELDWDVWNVMEGLRHRGYTIIILTGRDGSHVGVTKGWLSKHRIQYQKLLMRAPGDTRRDDVIKEEIFWRDIYPFHDVKLVIEDRPRVCRMWRSIGVKVMQVGNPHLEF